MKTLPWISIGAAVLLAGTSSRAQPEPPPSPPRTTLPSNAWFKVVDQDLGTVFTDDEVVARFAFTNPRDKNHQLSQLLMSCACTSGTITLGDCTYDLATDKKTRRVVRNADGTETREEVTHIDVAPGQTGEIAIRMKMEGMAGPRDAKLTAKTTDPEVPLVVLKWRALGAQYLAVDPPTVVLENKSRTDQHPFEFKISSPRKRDFNLTGHEPLPADMVVTEFTKKREGDKTYWVVKGTYGPVADAKAMGGTMVFKTDYDDRTVNLRVIAILLEPVTMSPKGFLSMGVIKKSEGKSTDIRLTPAGDYDLQVEKLELVRLRLAESQRDMVRFEHRKDGKDVVVSIRVMAGMEPAYLNGLLRIHLNHPSAKTRDVMFNGFVR